MPHSQYHHTQKSWFMIPLLLALALIVLLLAMAADMPVALRVLFFVLAGVVAAMAFIFSTLTIIIDDTHLRWHFGLGFWKKSVARSDIAKAEIARSKWWYGWGIRLTPRGWLYNVAGLDVVAIQLNTGKQFMIGTDEPQAVYAALQNVRP